jgi:hypothetical protein
MHDEVDFLAQGTVDIFTLTVTPVWRLILL